MATFSSPKRAFDPQSIVDVDPSKLGYTSFDDFFNVDGQTFLDDSSHTQQSPASFGFGASLSMGQIVPGSSAGTPINQHPSTANFVHPQQPSIWVDQNMWLDPTAGQKGPISDLDAKFDPSTFSGPHVDYGYLAGESNGLLGVGESGNISSCSPSISGSQACYSDVFFSSPSCSSSPQNFNAAELHVENGSYSTASRHTPSFDGMSRTLSSSSNHRAVARAGDETVFKAPTVPASATAQGRGRRSSSLQPSPVEHGDNISLFSVQDSLNHFQFSPRSTYLDESSLNRGNFVSAPPSYPNLIQPHHNTTTGTTPPYHISPPVGQHSHPISPATSHNSSQMWRQSQSESPFYGHHAAWQPRQSHSSSRRPSMHSVNSRISHPSPRHGSVEVDEDGKERTQCPYPDCGKAFKDLKAHMLTHQNERPEKCPITSCEFHKRGFARKYDRNRHLVTTHYKATIVCGFCPGTGSSAEKSFNRTDVFKRHLVAVHGVEQAPSNSKRRTPHNSTRQSPSLPDDATGKCSTCGNRFASPQELFEHFDDCVLRVVTQTDPGEDANEKNLLSVADDGDVRATMERHSLANDNGSSSTPSANDDADSNSDCVEDTIVSARAARSGKGSLAAPKSHASGTSLHTVTEGHVTKHTNRPHPAGKVTAGVTFSKGGVSLAASKGRKKRKHYPQSWGCPIDNMKLKKRVLCVFDGQRRLWKDDMMLGDDFEVRMQLPGAEEGAYITDLDVETLKRAEAFHGATDEERGPWIPSNYSGDWSLVQQQLTA